MQQGGVALDNVGDMDKQPFYRFIEDTYIAHPIALAALLYAVGGFPWLVWGMVSTAHLYIYIYVCARAQEYMLAQGCTQKFFLTEFF